MIKNTSTKLKKIEQLEQAIPVGIYPFLYSSHDGGASIWGDFYEARKNFFENLLELEKQLINFSLSRGHLYCIEQEFKLKLKNLGYFELNPKSRLAQIKTILELLSRLTYDKNHQITSVVFNFGFLLKDENLEDLKKRSNLVQADYRLIDFLKALEEPLITRQQANVACLIGDYLANKIHDELAYNYRLFNRFNRISDKKYKALKSYVEGLYKHQPRQYVVRCLFVRPIAHGNTASQNIFDLVRATKLFFKFAPKQEFFKKLDGYCWRLESPFSNKPSVQVVLFFNAEDIGVERRNLLRDLEIFWDSIPKEVSKEKTYLIIANRHRENKPKKLPKSRGKVSNKVESTGSVLLGVGNYRTKEYKDTLDKLIYYFAMSDDYFNIKDVPLYGIGSRLENRKIRVFGRGEIHKKHKARLATPKINVEG